MRHKQSFWLATGAAAAAAAAADTATYGQQAVLIIVISLVRVHLPAQSGRRRINAAETVTTTDHLFGVTRSSSPAKFVRPTADQPTDRPL